eukprot:gene31598-6794_t
MWTHVAADVLTSRLSQAGVSSGGQALQLVWVLGRLEGFRPPATLRRYMSQAVQPHLGALSVGQLAQLLVLLPRTGFRRHNGGLGFLPGVVEKGVAELGNMDAKQGGPAACGSGACGLLSAGLCPLGSGACGPPACGVRFLVGPSAAGGLLCGCLWACRVAVGLRLRVPVGPVGAVRSGPDGFWWPAPVGAVRVRVGLLVACWGLRLSSFLWGLARVNYQPSLTTARRIIAALDTAPLETQYSAQDLLRVLMSLASLKLPDLLRVLMSLASLKLPDLLRVLMSLALLKLPVGHTHRLRKRMLTATSSRMKSFTPKAAALVLRSLAAIKWQPNARWWGLFYATPLDERPGFSIRSDTFGADLMNAPASAFVVTPSELAWSEMLYATRLDERPGFSICNDTFGADLVWLLFGLASRTAAAAAARRRRLPYWIRQKLDGGGSSNVLGGARVRAGAYTPPTAAYVDGLVQLIKAEFTSLRPRDIARLVCALVRLKYYIGDSDGLASHWLQDLLILSETSGHVFSDADHLLMRSTWFQLAGVRRQPVSTGKKKKKRGGGIRLDREAYLSAVRRISIRKQGY